MDKAQAAAEREQFEEILRESETPEGQAASEAAAAELDEMFPPT